VINDGGFLFPLRKVTFPPQAISPGWETLPLRLAVVENAKRCNGGTYLLSPCTVRYTRQREELAT